MQSDLLEKMTERPKVAQQAYSRGRFCIVADDIIVAEDIRDTILDVCPAAEVEIVASLEAALRIAEDKHDFVALFSKINENSPLTTTVRTTLTALGASLVVLDAEWSNGGVVARANGGSEARSDGEFALTYPFSTDYLIEILTRIAPR